MKILFVCLGNICRSPLAEAVFKNAIAREEIEELITVDSAGTSDYHIGSGPDARSYENAKLNDINIEHCARQIESEDLKTFDYVIAMDKENFKNIIRLASSDQQKEKIYLMRGFEIDGTYSTRYVENVPDPYFGGEEGFQLVFDILKNSCDNLLSYLKIRHPELNK